MRISDWSSYVCSSDLAPVPPKCSSSPPTTNCVGIAARSARASTARTSAASAARMGFDSRLRATASSRRNGSAACPDGRSEEHTSELQSLMRTSYAVFCLQTQNDHQWVQTTNVDPPPPYINFVTAL